MTTSSLRGDIGELLLADAALGGLLINIAVMAAEADYPRRPKTIKRDLTTRQAMRKVREQLNGDATLFPDLFGSWLDEVAQVTDARNEIVHAVALNTCAECGTTSLYRHPRSGRHIDRTEETVLAVTGRVQALCRQGIAHADAIAELVNARVIKTARRAAEETNEVQNPPQVSAHRTAHVCRDCAPNGVGTATRTLNTAVEVWPPALRTLTK